jgi:TetR/AcrR family transcriptional regulator, transcriptional repressor for nem operon
MGRPSDAKERLMTAVMELIWTGSYDRTTIDQICDKAGVKKGSFYYFFESKANLAEAALEVGWGEYKKKLDAVFSATIPPLERLRRYCEMGYDEQVAMREKHGCVLGCPLCTLGSEVSTLEGGLRAKIDGIMQQMRLYLETAIRDAQAEGAVLLRDVATTSRVVHAYMEGLLAQARIQNNVELLREMPDGILMILGAKEQVAEAA